VIAAGITPQYARPAPPSRRRPAVIILDDLQEADLPSLATLRFMVRELRQAPVVTALPDSDQAAIVAFLKTLQMPAMPMEQNPPPQLARVPARP
jgi:hypothetical protein